MNDIAQVNRRLDKVDETLGKITDLLSNFKAAEERAANLINTVNGLSQEIRGLQEDIEQIRANQADLDKKQALTAQTSSTLAKYAEKLIYGVIGGAIALIVSYFK